MQPSTKSKQPVNKEAIRMLVADIGYTKASKQTGIKRDTLYHWGIRYGWNKAITDERPQAVKLVKSVADSHATALAELETETRISLARSARKLAKDSEAVTLRDADKVYTVAKTMAIVHRQDQGSNGQSFTLNVLNLGSLGVQVRQPDAQGDQTGSE